MGRLRAGAGPAAALLAVGLAGALAGCAVPTQEAYRDNVQGWVGRSADSLVAAWGAPDRSYTFGDGTRQLEYDRSQVRYVGGPPLRDVVPVRVRDASGRTRMQMVPVWREGPGHLDTDRCLTRFRTEPDGRIREVTFAGDWCVAFPPRGPGAAPEAPAGAPPPPADAAPAASNTAPRR